MYHRNIGAGGHISPTLTLSTRLTRDHFQVGRESVQWYSVGLQGGVVRVRCQAVIYSVWRDSVLAIFPGTGNSGTSHQSVHLTVFPNLAVLGFF